jgi:hypothetical protein
MKLKDNISDNENSSVSDDEMFESGHMTDDSKDDTALQARMYRELQYHY